jgi:hypothetical protein
MNDLFVESDYGSLNKYGENLCGDHVEVVQYQNQKTIVLADGLGSGVKANILSTLTSKIIATMIAKGMTLSDCVETIAQTLPTCKVRDIAYSTFTVLRFIKSNEVEIIQYDNPDVIVIRNNLPLNYDKKIYEFSDKTVYYSHLKLEENDIIIGLSDGCVHAGIGKTYNFGWSIKDISEYMAAFNHSGLSAKSLVSILLDKCNELYDGKCGDDTTTFIARVIKRKPVHVMIGPPKNQADTKRMMNLYFSKNGKKVVCGGTTSELVGKHLNKSVQPSLDYIDPNIPPIASIDGIDLVTEGVITIHKVLKNVKDYMNQLDAYKTWGYARDGASLLTKTLIEEATDIHFYVGQAINPAHQNPDLPIQFNIKMQLVNDLSQALKKIGKQITMSYF